MADDLPFGVRYFIPLAEIGAEETAAGFDIPAPGDYTTSVQHIHLDPIRKSINLKDKDDKVYKLTKLTQPVAPGTGTSGVNNAGHNGALGGPVYYLAHFTAEGEIEESFIWDNGQGHLCIAGNLTVVSPNGATPGNIGFADLQESPKRAMFEAPAEYDGADHTYTLPTGLPTTPSVMVSMPDGTLLWVDDAELRALIGPSHVLVIPGGGDLSVVDDANGATITNEGATALAEYDLPPASLSSAVKFVVLDADGIAVSAVGDDTIYIGEVQGTLLSCDRIGCTITLEAVNTTTWVAMSVVGNWDLS